ncbi:MAG TPA: tetratricopeptide repeat protein [Thermoanaerobaculia bacterium]|jgi:predicted double-glycine peptidase
MKNFILLFVLTSVSCVYWTPRNYQPSTAATVVENVPMQKWDIKSCGAGALSAVLQHHGDPTSMDQWQETLPKTRGGVMSIDLVLAARQKGYDARLVSGDRSLVEAEVKDGRPVILMLQVIQAPGKINDFFHYIVVDGYDETRRIFRTQFGDGRARWTPIESVVPAWQKTKFATIVVRPADPNAEALRAAVRLEEEGKLALAAHAYRDILKNDPASMLAWTNLGNVEMRLERRAAAEEAFRKALELEPDSADTLNNLAWLLYEEKRMDEAEPLARKAVAAAAPDPWMRLDTLARILAAKGNCEEAQKTFDYAVAAAPADARASLGSPAPCVPNVAAR